MKSFLVACGLLVPALAVPGPAMAQTPAPTSTIVVTEKNQKTWDKGSKLEAEGIGELEKAKKQLVRTSAAVVDAQNKRDSASALASNASQQFRKLMSAAPTYDDPQAAAKWADQLDKVASQWAKNSARSRDGESELKKAMKEQSRAQSQVVDAQDKVERGRALKSDAQRLSAMAGKG